MGAELERLQDQYRGAMLGALVGDAVGARFEGRLLVLRRDVDRHARKSEPLRYTDDTLMTIGLADSLVARRGFDGAHMAHTFAQDWRLEPWRGYGSGPPQVFAAYARGVPWDRAGAVLFDGAGSFGNGAAMRVAPVALLCAPDLDGVARLARQTASITHTHQLGVEGAVLQALAVAMLLDEPAPAPLEADVAGYAMSGSGVAGAELLGAGPSSTGGAEAVSTAGCLDAAWLIARLAERIKLAEYREKLDEIRVLLPDATTIKVASQLGNGVAAQTSVPTALYAFLRSPRSFMESVCFAISLGGDADTIGSMAGALSGAYLGASAIPRDLLDRIEGVDVLCELADALFALRQRG